MRPAIQPAAAGPDDESGPMGLFTTKHRRRTRKRMSERLFRRFVYKYYAQDLLIDLQLEAKRESVQYIRRHMMHCMHFNNAFDLLRNGLAEATTPGLVLEFGVYTGGTIRAIAEWTDGPVHGFDSFEGLPDNWDGTFETKGKFTVGGRLPRVPSNVTLHAGWFDDTLPRFLKQHNEPVSFVHIDCDIYSSTRTVLGLLADRLRAGAVIVFDEYFNYNNWQQHEFRAFQEFVAERGLRYEYLGFTARGGGVSARILETGATPGPVAPAA